MVDIKKKISELRKTKGKIYAPMKYFKGLKTEKEVEQRYMKMLQSNYKPFPTDVGKIVKPSKYTKAFQKEFPKAFSLSSKAKVTGVPLSVIKKVYDKGLAAWRTGHRPGATQQAWGYARVHSFLMRGKTFYTTDKTLVEEAMKHMKPNDIKKWLKRTPTI
jgi:hypothetical protein